MKIDSEIFGTVVEIITHKGADFDKPPFRDIVLICNSEHLPENFEITLTYSVTWSKKNLKVGDKIRFKAKVKKTPNDNPYSLIRELMGVPLDTEEPTEIFEIINVKQIVKV